MQVVAVVDAAPPDGRMMTQISSTLQVEGRAPNTGSPTGGMVVHRQVTPDFFSIHGIKTVQCRLFPNPSPHGARMRAFHGPSRPSSPPSLLRSSFLLRLSPLNPRPIETFPLAPKVSALTDRPRFQAAQFGGFAFACLASAAIGIYGVLAFLDARRTKESGIHMELGATAAQVRQLVLRQATTWTVFGIALGLAVTYATKLQQGSTPAAPVLAITALLATWIPSTRDARVDLASALRGK